MFAAALTSIAAQHHEVKSKDAANRLVTFHVGITAWSWGYNMILKVAPGENSTSDVSVEIARSGGKAVSWGSGKKEVQKIFNEIEKELAKAPTVAQEVSRETVEGVTNFYRLGTTVACAGATKAEAVPEIKRMGFASIINLRQASEPGADIEAEAAAAEAAGIRYYHIPFD
ncbi:MAG: sulfur transferase domain-containing protein, partial [Candidatus Acidiferrum sp.]